MLVMSVNCFFALLLFCFLSESLSHDNRSILLEELQKTEEAKNWNKHGMY
jgi:hypothetical protein